MVYGGKLGYYLSELIVSDFKLIKMSGFLILERCYIKDF